MGEPNPPNALPVTDQHLHFGVRTPKDLVGLAQIDEGRPGFVQPHPIRTRLGIAVLPADRFGRGPSRITGGASVAFLQAFVLPPAVPQFPKLPHHARARRGKEKPSDQLLPVEGRLKISGAVPVGAVSEGLFPAYEPLFVVALHVGNEAGLIVPRSVFVVGGGKIRSAPISSQIAHVRLAVDRVHVVPGYHAASVLVPVSTQLIFYTRATEELQDHEGIRIHGIPDVIGHVLPALRHCSLIPAVVHVYPVVGHALREVEPKPVDVEFLEPVLIGAVDVVLDKRATVV